MIVPALAPRVVVVTLAVLGGALLLPGPAQADRSGSDPHAVAMISRAMTAPSQVSYSGTQFVAAWSAKDPSESTSMMADIEHVAGGSTVVRAHGAADGARVDPPDGAVWLASRGPLEVLTDAHTLSGAGRAKIAGRSAVVIDALRSDGSVAARLWLDDETALPLRREVYDASGTTVRASAFVDITLSAGSAATADLASQDASDRPEPSQRLGEAELEDLRASGWNCPRELSSGLALYEAKQVGSAVQLSYTDGVAAVSVFEQPGTLGPDVVDDFTAIESGDGVYYRAPGPPTRYVWETAGYVVTVIADAPALADAVLAAMPPETDESSGFLVRVGHGAQRLMSWVNPFD